jgi:hypothetical protein
MNMQTLFEILDDVPRPNKKDELPRWTVDLILRLRDQRVLDFLRKELESLRRSGTPYNRMAPLMLFKQGQYDVATAVHRDVFSVRRSIKRLVAMRKLNFILEPIDAV